MSNESPAQEFSGLRALFWPIHNFELKKFLPTALIMFCLLFNYTVMRDVKDALVVNSAGAHVISFLKLYCVTPAAILFVILYAKLCNVFDNEKIFYVIVTPFLVFFGLFAFFIYPNLDVLHPAQETIQALHAAYPRFSGFIDLYAYWSYSLFYVLAELWGSAMVSLMFWQFANRITKMAEAKRFYGFFSVIANFALIFSGQAVKFFSTGIEKYITAGDPWGVSLKLLCGAIIILGIVAMGIYRWMHKNVLVDPKYYDPTEEKKSKKKEKLSLIESGKLLLQSRELAFIACLVLLYGVTINLVEVQWKYQASLYVKNNPSAFNSIMGDKSTMEGIITILLCAFVGNNLLRRLPWFIPAVITPIFLLLVGGTFFTLILGKEAIAAMLGGMDPLTMAVFFGLSVVMSAKAVKYSLFDPTKEMAYIPLDAEIKTKGKAAVDVIGGRGGKSGGALIQSIFTMIFATKEVIIFAPYTFAIFAFGCFLWIASVKGLNRSIKESAAKKETA